MRNLIPRLVLLAAAVAVAKSTVYIEDSAPADHVACVRSDNAVFNDQTIGVKLVDGNYHGDMYYYVRILYL